jgi:1-hydroxycarotenoid 3,4-desaturase
MGGLAAAIELAAGGGRVTLCEAASQVGGKAARVRIGNRTVASGPTVLTMPWVFDRLFAHVDMDTAAALTLQPLERLARHFWPGGETLDLFTDAARSQDAVGAFAGATEADNFARFMTQAAATYLALRDSFLCATRPGPLTLTWRTGLRGSLAIHPFRSLWSTLCRHFHDPRLRQLFGRYATYCGASPFAAPATLMLIAHVEQMGVQAVSGGIPCLADALADAARRLGVEIRCDAPVREISVRNGQAVGVELDDGEYLAADAVIANCDAAAFAAGHLGASVSSAAAAVPAAARSLSAVTWSLLGTAEGPPLDYHNVFFSADYEREFADILQQRQLPREPTVYVCAQDRAGGQVAASGAQESLFCLINAPADGDRHAFTTADVEAGLCSARASLAAAGVRLSIDAGAVETPADYHRRFPGSGGALYGRASHGWRATFDRPGNRSRIPGLYLAGGTVHPGPGVPMAALSGIQAAACVWQDLTSQRR